MTHPFEPLFDENSKILILGSFPSVRSREQRFYYGHPQNRFWKLMAALLKYEPDENADSKEYFTDEKTGVTLPVSQREKTRMLKNGRIALWDTIASCDITGSQDSSISNVETNDLRSILDKAPIDSICCNGNKSYELFMKYTAPELESRRYTGRDISFIKLPSTSPANAAWSFERLKDEWGRLTGLCPQEDLAAGLGHGMKDA